MANSTRLIADQKPSQGFKPAKEKIGNFLIRRRILISFIIFSLFIYEDFNEKVLPQNILNFNNPISVVAIGFIVIGVFLRSWAAGVIRKTKQLATEGPYALTRHPLYLGSLFIAMGFAIVFWDMENILVICGVAVILYIPKIRREENHLANQFGIQWAHYCDQTALLFPKHKPELRSGWSLKQWLYNREYKAMFASLAGVLTLVLIAKIFGGVSA